MNNNFIISGKYSTTMYEEHACKLYQAQTHCSCWIHLRWSRVLDTSGEKYTMLIKNIIDTFLDCPRWLCKFV